MPNALPVLDHVRADRGYAGPFAAWLHETRGWRVEVVRHPARQLWRRGHDERPARALRVLPRHGVVERAFAWLDHSGRPSEDYGRLPAASETMLYAATTRPTLRRLARTPAQISRRPLRRASVHLARVSGQAAGRSRRP